MLLMMQKTYLEIESKILCGLKSLYANILDIILKSIQVRKIDLKWQDIASDADMIHMIKGREMSEFEKELEKFNLENGTDYRTLNQYSDVLTTHFKDWKPPKQLVELPQIIADWIELIKQRNRNVLTLLDSDDMPDDVYDWLFIKEDDENINLILLAWIDGYTVEKPKEILYFVKLPGVPTLNSYMCKSCSPGELGYNEKYSSKNFNEVRFGLRYDKKYSGGWQRQFTESEIKAIDKRYWTFAVKVEED